MNGASSYKPKLNAAVWVVRAGKGGRYAYDFEVGGFVAIRFYPVGDISGMSHDQVRALVAKKRPGKKGKMSGDAGMLYRFANEIELGDIIVAPDSETRELLFGEVKGPYQYRDTPAVSDFHHVRKVEWLGRRERDDLPQEVLRSLSTPMTVFRPKGCDHLLALWNL